MLVENVNTGTVTALWRCVCVPEQSRKSTGLNKDRPATPAQRLTKAGAPAVAYSAASVSKEQNEKRIHHQPKCAQ